MSMSVWTLIVAAAGGGALGFLVALLWRARREQAVRVELELLRVRIKSDESAALDRDAALARTREQLQAAFGELARTSLQSNNEMFLQLARERLDRDKQDAAAMLKERETAIESLIQPIREAIGKTEVQIQNIERERIDAFAGIRSQMELLTTGQHVLSRETRNLVTALRRPDVRGRWGEMTLKRLVELSGMSAYADFTEQQYQMTESGAIRPDMIVHMPERRDIVVDVKTPLDAYLAAVEAQTEDDRGRELKRHAQVVGARVRELASKQYWAQFEHSPDFVVLFLPGDQFLSAALQESPDLIDDALRQSVMLATPTSLVALLKTVALGWKQAALAENAAEIRKLGEDMYKRLGVFADHLTKLGKSLGASVDSFNKAVGSLEQQVMPAARRFPGLGLRVNRELELIEPVDTLTRIPRITAPGEASPGEASPGEASPGDSSSRPASDAGRSEDA
jgi:DNA recombination protein RmuC